jgi:hypothetical protein
MTLTLERSGPFFFLGAFYGNHGLIYPRTGTVTPSVGRDGNNQSVISLAIYVMTP